jgi:hypothetical protein
MLLTNIRIEAPSDRPSPMQVFATAFSTLLDAANMGWGLALAFHPGLMMYRLNRAVTSPWSVVRGEPQGEGA